jgi:hypothetical protein
MRLVQAQTKYYGALFEDQSDRTLGDGTILGECLPIVEGQPPSSGTDTEAGNTDHGSAMEQDQIL